MRFLRTAHRAAWAAALGLAFGLLVAGCGGATAPSQPATPHPSLSPSPSASPSPSPARVSPRPATPSPSITASPSPSASRSPTPTATPCPADNKLRAWYYIPNDAHRLPGIPDDARRLLLAYGAHYVADTGERVVYLTFDAGYENGHTGPILDALRAAGVKATFFLTGTYIRGNPALVRRMAAEGHTVASHTFNHPSLPSLAWDRAAFAGELAETERAYRRATGRELAPLLRPPAGEYSARSLCLTRQLGYTTIFWSFAHRDWLVDDQPPVGLTVQRILAASHRGAIYLLHAISSSDAAALPEAIAGLRAQGYRLAPLSENP